MEASQEWVEGLDVLVLSIEQTEGLLDAAARSGDPADGLMSAVAGAAQAHENAWVRSEVTVTEERQRVAEQRVPLEAEQAELNASRTPEPNVAHTRTADRAGRAGAPLWRLVDFDENLPAAQRAGLEAALEAAGVLDAWVLPDGGVLDIDGDVALIAADHAPGRQLSELLHPVDGAVTTEVIAALLAAVGVGDIAGAASGLRVDVDGSFRSGPAVGRFGKPVAQFIGASAREANRARRLAELGELLDALDARDGELAVAVAAIEAKRRALKDELALLPSEDGARSAFAAVRSIQQHLTTLHSDARESRRQAEQANEAAANARNDCAEHARDRRLPAPGEQPSLDSLIVALSDYSSRVSDLVSHIRSGAQYAEHAAAAETRASRAQARAESLAEQHRSRDARLQQHRGALEVLEASKGEDAEAALGRLTELGQAITALEGSVDTTTKRREDAAVEHARLEVTIENTETLLSQRETVRDARLQQFRALDGPDFLRLAVDEAAPTLGVVQQWGAGHVQTFARENAELLRARSSVEELTNRVEAEYQRLMTDMDGSVGVRPYRQRVDGLDVIAATRSGREVSVRVLLHSLDEEIEAQQRNLTEADQKAFERFLFNGIAQHLRARISGAQRLVEDTNAAIAECQTSSGMSVELAWEAMADDDPLLRRALQLLRSAPEAMSETEREQLIRFFRERVENARLTQDEGTATEHLLGALDYRQWHRFSVMQTRDGVSVPMTKKQHESGSGGEKAASLHLPLFAAAAAHMKSAAEHAPRLVMLDEAFAGIDNKMRSQLLGLLERLDLDFLLTSHELWCCERELEHLSIYQLHREEGTPGVAAVHFLWDGAAGTRREVDATDIVPA